MVNGPADLGGTHGFGPVVREGLDEPAFHHDWERRSFGLQFATMEIGLFNLDEVRYATEMMDPLGYLGSSYYEQWLACTEALLVEKEILTWDEIDARAAEFRTDPSRPMPSVEDPGVADRAFTSFKDGVSEAREVPRAPRFSVGDRVVTRTDAPRGHTRLPRYTRGRRAVVVRSSLAFVLPDSNAHGDGEAPEHTYQIRLEADELWGSTAESGTAVYLDVWETYIRPA